MKTFAFLFLLGIIVFWHCAADMSPLPSRRTSLSLGSPQSTSAQAPPSPRSSFYRRISWHASSSAMSSAQRMDAAVAALYSTSAGGWVDPVTHELTGLGRARWCPQARSAFADWESAVAASDQTGVAAWQGSTWADALFERGCLDDAQWAGWYVRVHARHLANQSMHQIMNTSAGWSPGTDASDYWENAELTSSRECEVLQMRDDIGADVCAGNANPSALALDIAGL